MSEQINTDNFQIYIDSFFSDLKLYDDYRKKHDYKSLLKAAIDAFLQHESDYTAKEVYRIFFMIYQITDEDKSQRQEDKSIIGQPNTLLHLVNVMETYEKNTGELIDRQRDHFIHSVNVFLLGLAIYSQNSKYRSLFKNYIEKSGYEKYYRYENNDVAREEFLYRWGIASLLHDIGYPFEIIGKQLKKIINDGVKSISNSYDVDIGIDYRDFNQFNSLIKKRPYDFGYYFFEHYEESRILDLYKPTDIMAYKIAMDFGFDDEKFELLLKHLDNFVQYMRENDFIDHGFYSAILVLNSYGKIIQKYGKNPIFFFYPVVDSATAILLHNYYNKTLQKAPFNLKQMSPYQSPIAYLLILCDELQEWNRQPFGLIDKKKLHVNELAIEINEHFLDMEFILKKGSMGLGFSKDKKKFINEVLDIETIFKKGLAVSTNVKPEVEEEIMRNMDIADIQAPDILMRNIESLAREINNQYNISVEQQYLEKIEKGLPIDDELEKSYKYRCDFDDLEPEFKLSNLRQARSIPKKLNMIGCEIASLTGSDTRPALSADDFDEKEKENLARFEHIEWCEEKRGNGWVFGEIKNNERRETPNLVEWEKLDPDIKELDRNTVSIIPTVLEKIGLKVVESKIRLLTIEMHNFYSSHEKDIQKFEDLPDYIKFSNYKQTDFLVKILNEKGFDLVSADEPGKEITRFDDRDLDYFAEREHYGWCRLKIALGWKYGLFDEEGKTSPNLLQWEDLDENIKKSNRKTFEYLPFICKDPKIGLKIVKSE